MIANAQGDSPQLAMACNLLVNAAADMRFARPRDRELLEWHGGVIVQRPFANFTAPRLLVARKLSYDSP